MSQWFPNPNQRWIDSTTFPYYTGDGNASGYTIVSLVTAASISTVVDRTGYAYTRKAVATSSDGCEVSVWTGVPSYTGGISPVTDQYYFTVTTSPASNAWYGSYRPWTGGNLNPGITVVTNTGTSASSSATITNGTVANSTSGTASAVTATDFTDTNQPWLTNPNYNHCRVVMGGKVAVVTGSTTNKITIASEGWLGGTPSAGAYTIFPGNLLWMASGNKHGVMPVSAATFQGQALGGSGTGDFASPPLDSTGQTSLLHTVGNGSTITLEVAYWNADYNAGSRSAGINLSASTQWAQILIFFSLSSNQTVSGSLGFSGSLSAISTRPYNPIIARHRPAGKTQLRVTELSKHRPAAILQSRYTPLKAVQRTTSQLDSVPFIVDVAVTETYPYQVDVSNYLASGETITSISSVLTNISTGAVITSAWQGSITTAGNIIQVIVNAPVLQLGQQYQLATTFTAATGKRLTVLSQLNMVA